MIAQCRHPTWRLPALPDMLVPGGEEAEGETGVGSRQMTQHSGKSQKKNRPPDTGRGTERVDMKEGGVLSSGHQSGPLSPAAMAQLPSKGWDPAGAHCGAMGENCRVFHGHPCRCAGQGGKGGA